MNGDRCCVLFTIREGKRIENLTENLLACFIVIVFSIVYCLPIILWCGHIHTYCYTAIHLTKSITSIACYMNWNRLVWGLLLNLFIFTIHNTKKSRIRRRRTQYYIVWFYNILSYWFLTQHSGSRHNIVERLTVL